MHQKHFTFNDRKELCIRFVICSLQCGPISGPPARAYRLRGSPPASQYSELMKRRFLCLAAIVMITTIQADPQAHPAPEGSAARAPELIEILHLSVLPRESGYLVLIRQSAQTVTVHAPPPAVQCHVYYTIPPDNATHSPHILHPH